MKRQRVDVLVIGGGPAGLGAAAAAREAGAKRVVIVERLPYPGGILPQCIHDGFGVELLNRCPDRLQICDDCRLVLVHSCVSSHRRTTLAAKLA